MITALASGMVGWILWKKDLPSIENTRAKNLTSMKKF
jgi:hypothetical protein